MKVGTRRVALVTGAASGIGEGIARHLASQGRAVAVVDRDGDGAASVADAIDGTGAEAVAVVADVSSDADVAAAVSAVSDGLGPVDILVNNAGFARDSALVEMTLADWDDVVGTHLRGTYLMTRAVAPGMQARRWGRIVNISSISALGGPNRANYVSAKAGIEGFTRAAAHELAAHGITVNAIGPGVVQTGMTAIGAARAGRTLDEHLDVLRKTVAVGRIGTPYDIARAVSFFTDEDADFVTGQVIYVSGTPHG